MDDHAPGPPDNAPSSLGSSQLQVSQGDGDSPSIQGLRDSMFQPDAEQCRAAAQAEYDSPLDVGTYDLVRLPCDKMVVDDKWAFKDQLYRQFSCSDSFARRTWGRSLTSSYRAKRSRCMGEPTAFVCDNMSALALAGNPAHHERTKHFAVRQQYVRERVDNGDITVEYIATDRNAADILTKALARFKHSECMARHDAALVVGEC
jgi:hypothetical protein